MAAFKGSAWTALVMLLCSLPSSFCVERYVTEDIITFVPPPRDCCFGDDNVFHGQTALSLPECCSVLECRDGSLLKKHTGAPGAVNCCEFDGVMYPEGAHLPAHCVHLVCSRGTWVFQHMDDCCAVCHVYPGIHVDTFDGVHVDLPDLCSYTLTQTGRTYNPRTAVYANFSMCAGHGCLVQTIFKENPNAVITLGPRAFDVIVNNDNYVVPVAGVHPVTSSAGTHPVLVWRQDKCLVLLGASKIMVIHCGLSVDVWAFPTLFDNLDGLCGHFNFYRDDDLTTRDGEIQSLIPQPLWPRAFADSWKTRDQSRQQCRHKCIGCPIFMDDPCEAGNKERQQHLAICRRELHPVIGIDKQLNTEVVACASTLCLMDQPGATHYDWLHNIILFIHHRKRTIARIEDNWVPSYPPSSGNCSPGASWMEDCNWCHCINGHAACTKIACPSDFTPDLGEAVCENGWWRQVPHCEWCQCVRGGRICSREPCIPIVCHLPPDVGPCLGSMPRYYYSPTDGHCQVFNYGGCLGNDNNFKTLQECEALCAGVTPTGVTEISTEGPPVTQPPRCLLPMDAGPCNNYLLRYYYDQHHHQCRPFTYGGCVGNYNNFPTIQECQVICGGF